MPELTRRYVVMAMAAAAPFDPADRDAPFVLKPWKDPTALIALKTYRDHCYPELARDLDEWIRLVEAGPRVLGGVGRQNEAHASTKPVSRSSAAAGVRRASKTGARVRAKVRGKASRAGGRRAAKPKRRRR
jgi:hypothetical protein